MSAKLDAMDGGRGNALPSGRAEELAGQDAAEAIGQLEGGFATGAMPLAQELSFPGPIAQAFFLDNRPVVGIQGPVGSGKTTTLVYSRIRRARQMPRSVIDGWRRYKLLGVRETYRQLWSSTIPSYLETVPRALGTWSGGRGAPVQHRVEFEDEFGPIEWITEFMAFGDDVIASMRGIQTTDIWENEADTNPVEVLTTGIGRINRWPGQRHFVGYPDELRGYGQIVCDFNAPDRENWAYAVFHDEAARRRVEGELGVQVGFWNQPGGRSRGAENLHNLAPGYYATQVAAMKLAGRGDMIKRLVDNEITYLRAGDPVFKREFNPAIHVSRDELEVDPVLPLRLGFDQGFVPAAVIAQFRPPHHWRIYADLMLPKERLLAREFGNRVRDLLDTPRFAGIPVMGGWGDMAGEAGSSLAEEDVQTWNLLVSIAAGISIRPQRIGANRIQPRLEAVRAALEYVHGGEPGLVIDGVHCRWLPAAFEARYVWADEIDRRGDKRKVPDKSLPEANAMDALQYLMLSEVRGDGASPITRHDHVGPSRRPGEPEGASRGLSSGFDLLDPYHGRAAWL